MPPSISKMPHMTSQYLKILLREKLTEKFILNVVCGVSAKRFKNSNLVGFQPSVLRTKYIKT